MSVSHHAIGPPLQRLDGDGLERAFARRREPGQLEHPFRGDLEDSIKLFVGLHLSEKAGRPARETREQEVG